MIKTVAWTHLLCGCLPSFKLLVLIKITSSFVFIGTAGCCYVIVSKLMVRFKVGIYSLVSMVLSAPLFIMICLHFIFIFNLSGCSTVTSPVKYFPSRRLTSKPCHAPLKEKKMRSNCMTKGVILWVGSYFSGPMTADHSLRPSFR